jgi:hypothetical protein
MIGIRVANDNVSEAKGFVVLRGALVLGEIAKVNGYWIAKDHERNELTYRLDKDQAFDDVVEAYRGKSQVRG